jgi:hypothetical protein
MPYALCSMPFLPATRNPQPVSTSLDSHPPLSYTFQVTVHGFRVHVKSDPLIREYCDLPRQCHVTARGKTRENYLIAYEQNPEKKVTLNGELPGPDLTLRCSIIEIHIRESDTGRNMIL